MPNSSIPSPRWYNKPRDNHIGGGRRYDTPLPRPLLHNSPVRRKLRVRTSGGRRYATP